MRPRIFALLFIGHSPRLRPPGLWVLQFTTNIAMNPRRGIIHKHRGVLCQSHTTHGSVRGVFIIMHGVEILLIRYVILVKKRYAKSAEVRLLLLLLLLLLLKMGRLALHMKLFQLMHGEGSILVTQERLVLETFEQGIQVSIELALIGHLLFFITGH